MRANSGSSTKREPTTEPELDGVTYCETCGLFLGHAGHGQQLGHTLRECVVAIRKRVEHVFG